MPFAHHCSYSEVLIKQDCDTYADDIPRNMNAGSGSLFGSHGHNPNVPMVLKTVNSYRLIMQMQRYHLGWEELVQVV